MIDIAQRLQDFMEHDARSCSMDFGCITPEYVLGVDKCPLMRLLMLWSN